MIPAVKVLNAIGTNSVGVSFLYSIVTDKMCGRPNRYTVYKLELGGMNRARVIGRELPMRVSKQIIKKQSDGPVLFFTDETKYGVFR